MKLGTIVKITLISSVVLLCSGFALYSYFKLSAAEEQKDFDLYTLVPPTASAVFATDNIERFTAQMDGLTSSAHHQYLHVSKLFTYLRQYLYTLQEEAPHGLSRQMNQLVVSFHEPDNDRNQILYCNLGAGDHELISNFVQKYLSSAYRPKQFTYRGEEIVIYPMSDGDFLACYLTKQHLVLSSQKRLVEEVIDAQKTKKSLSSDPAFKAARVSRISTAPATLYTRLEGLVGWTEFDLELKNDLIYLTGVSHQADTCSNLLNVLCRQDSVRQFSRGRLPASSLYFSRMGVTDWSALLSLDDALSRYLAENGGHDVAACLFQQEDSLLPPAAVLSVSLSDVPEAERVMNELAGRVAVESGTGKRAWLLHDYAGHKVYTVHRFPPTSLFARLTGFTEYPSDMYVTFFDSRLLMSPDEESLSGYIRQISSGALLDEEEMGKAGIEGLPSTYRFMLMADFERLFKQPRNPVRFLPDFFFRNSGFFRYYTLFAQFNCNDGVGYPNFILKYRSGNESGSEPEI